MLEDTVRAGRTIQELAAEVARQAGAKKDYVAPARKVVLLEPTRLSLEGIGEFGMTDLFHEQVAGKLAIPQRYYDRMKSEAPDLLAANVNGWLGRTDGRYMVRTLDGRARAFLSDRFRPLDNADLAEAILPAIGHLELQVLSCEVTERRLYIKAVDNRITKDVPKGTRMGDGSHQFFDTLSPAIVVSNSEVGCGALAIETAVWTSACTNLAIAAQHSMRKYHLGGKIGNGDTGEAIYNLLTDQTKRLTDAALWAQAKDLVAAAFNQARFDALVGEIAGMANQKIEGDPVKAIEVTGKRFGFQESERVSVLQHLIEGGDLSRYGLFNAVTRTAEDVADYDRATQFERFGGDIIELAPNDWKVIANPN
jgi:hypothetical protein